MFSGRHAVHRVLVVWALPWAKARAVAMQVVPQVAAKSVVPSGISLLPTNDLTAFLPNGKEELWGFWAGDHWIPHAALFRRDWSIKPNGRVYQDLVFHK